MADLRTCGSSRASDQSGQGTERWNFGTRYAKVSTHDRQCQYNVRIREHIVPTITPLQMKLGRTAVGLGVRDLATEAGVAPSTVQRFESGKGDMHSRTLDRVQAVLEGAGIIFIPADAAGGPGVRLAKSGTST